MHAPGYTMTYKIRPISVENAESAAGTRYDQTDRGTILVVERTFCSTGGGTAWQSIGATCP